MRPSIVPISAGYERTRAATPGVNPHRSKRPGNRDGSTGFICTREVAMIRKLKSGEYRLYSRKVDPRTHKRKNLGTFKSREAAEKHEREVQYFKRH